MDGGEMRRLGVRIGTCVALVLTASLVVPASTASAASSKPKVTSATISATCVEVPFPPTVNDYAVHLTVPRVVHRGETFTVHLRIDFAVSPSVTLGYAYWSGGPAVTPTNPLFGGSVQIDAPPGASSISGDASFVATRAKHATAEWTLGNFGQAFLAGGHGVAQSCTPASGTALAHTRIV
jgi:hypothetical protein